MKYYFSIILCFSFYTVCAQKNIVNHIDTIYYLIDTTNTPVNDRMWNIEKDKIFKYYTIQCPCLKNGGKPTFSYNIMSKDNGIYISKKDLKTIKLVNLNALIFKSKQIENNDYKRDYAIFLIEPTGKKYIMHEVNFENPAIKVIWLPDVLERKIDTTTFRIKGAIQTDSKNLAKYINQPVITSGKIVVAREIERDKVGLLIAGTDSLNQDFTIIIKGENLRNFYPMTFYKRRVIKITGKVTEYMGKPAIELSDKRQILQLSPRQK